MTQDKQAIVLCSGGLDSVVTSFYVKNTLKYKDITLIFFNYNQKSLKQEQKFSKLCAKSIGGKFLEINVNELGDLSNSLINQIGKITKLKRKDLKNTAKESEKYYVPCRNTLFLVYALAVAESLYQKNKRTSDIFVGFKCEGKESYPDTTKNFVLQMNKLSKIACIKPFSIFAPLITKDKEDIVQLGSELGVDFTKTFSCYASKKNKHCGICLACMLRKEGFYWANINDPTEYHKT